jgi:hypothetical protein
MSTVTLADKDKITITISRKTHDELDSIGVRGETFDAIIQKCIAAYKKQQKAGEYRK